MHNYVQFFLLCRDSVTWLTTRSYRRAIYVGPPVPLHLDNKCFQTLEHFDSATNDQCKL